MIVVPLWVGVAIVVIGGIAWLYDLAVARPRLIVVALFALVLLLFVGTLVLRAAIVGILGQDFAFDQFQVLEHLHRLFVGAAVQRARQGADAAGHRGRQVGAGSRAVLGEVGQVAAGVLQHLDQADVQLVDHHPVHLTHLVGRERRQRPAGGAHHAAARSGSGSSVRRREPMSASTSAETVP